jgi:hypothetical protein
MKLKERVELRIAFLRGMFVGMFLWSSFMLTMFHFDANFWAAHLVAIGFGVGAGYFSFVIAGLTDSYLQSGLKIREWIKTL